MSAAEDRLDELRLATTDAIRFPRHPARTTRVDGRPLDVALDGSISCFELGGRLRAIRAEFIEVKRRGPRGGTRWDPLVQNQPTDPNPGEGGTR